MSREAISSRHAPAALGPYSQAIRAGRRCGFPASWGSTPRPAIWRRVSRRRRTRRSGTCAPWRRPRVASSRTSSRSGYLAADGPRRLRPRQCDHDRVFLLRRSRRARPTRRPRCRRRRASRSRACCTSRRSPAPRRSPAGATPSNRTRGSDRPGCEVGPAREGGEGGETREGGRRPRRQARAARHSRQEDLVLHLPLRYEDHTRLVPLPRLQPGPRAAGRGHRRPHRHPVPAAAAGRVPAGGRGPRQRRPRAARPALFMFYPNQQKALAPGRRVRAFGDVRPGHFGLEIVHLWTPPGGRRRHPAARSAHSRLSDDGGLAGHAAARDRTRARRRSRAHCRFAAGRFSASHCICRH